MNISSYVDVHYLIRCSPELAHVSVDGQNRGQRTGNIIALINRRIFVTMVQCGGVVQTLV